MFTAGVLPSLLWPSIAMIMPHTSLAFVFVLKVLIISRHALSFSYGFFPNNDSFDSLIFLYYIPWIVFYIFSLVSLRFLTASSHLSFQKIFLPFFASSGEKLFGCKDDSFSKVPVVRIHILSVVVYFVLFSSRQLAQQLFFKTIVFVLIYKNVIFSYVN